MSRTRIARRRAAALIALPAILATITTTNLAEGANSQPAKIKLSKSKAKYGKNLRISGTYEPRRTQVGTLDGQAEKPADGEPQTQERPANPVVSIRFRKAGSDNFKTVRRVQTRDDGYFTTKLKVRRSGKYRTLSNDGRYSQVRDFRVKSKTKAKLKDTDVLAGERAKVKGRVFPTTGGRKVTVKVAGKSFSTRTRSDGRFTKKVKAGGTGKKTVKALARSNKIAAGSSDRAGRLTVYRRAFASWYGPGFYGNRTACGQTLGYNTVGVAHKTMPCGTKLTLRHNGNEVDVQVIDRGPYAHGREFDLTRATKERLGFGSTGYVLTSK